MSMGFDSYGLFHAELPIIKGKCNPAPIPETNWKPPIELPNLKHCELLAIDVETYDPHLKEYGAGWAHGNGELVGVSLAADPQHAWYLPMRHRIQEQYNMDADKVIAYLRDTLKGKMVVGTNIVYDLGWLQHEGISTGKAYDVSYAEALLTETDSLSLDDIARKYLSDTKTSEQLYDWCAASYGGQATQIQRKNIYRAPPSLVGKYAEQDALLPLKLMPILARELKEQKLWQLFNEECELIPFLLIIKKKGVRVDVAKAEVLYERFNEDMHVIEQRLYETAGRQFKILSSADIASIFDKLKVKYERNAVTGNPILTQQALERIKHPLAKDILKYRSLQKINKVFIKSYIIDSHSNERLHCDYRPLRSESGGTRSGRYSSSNPNLQNLPIRDPEHKGLVRSLFRPEQGEQWYCVDYNQVEFRLLTHFAKGIGAEEARENYCNNPDTDYHDMTLALVEQFYNFEGYETRENKRRTIKGINFGLVYGMGIKKLAASLKLTQAKAQELFNKYHAAVPFVNATMHYYIQQAEVYNEIRTLNGRVSRFNQQNTYKALNRLLQGSAADILKNALLKASRQKLFQAVGYPLTMVHDELNFSLPHECINERKRITDILENTTPMSIPITVTWRQGKDWGTLTSLKEQSQ